MSVGVACFVGGGLIAFVVVTIIAQKRWANTMSDSSSQETANQKSPGTQKNPDYKESSKTHTQKVTDPNFTQKLPDTLGSSSHERTLRM